MYQDIDDPEWEQQNTKTRKRALWLTLCLSLIALLIIGGVIYSVYPKPQIENGPNAAEMEHSLYATAIDESSKPLQRARLRDFIQTYPNAATLDSAKTQLLELDNAEADDWAILSDLVYNRTLSDTDKKDAIQAYIRDWGPLYLGERENDILSMQEDLGIVETLKTEIERDTYLNSEGILKRRLGGDSEGDLEGDLENFTAEDFAAPTPNYSDQLSETILAGGVRRPVFESRSGSNPKPVTHQRTAQNIIPPKVRKNVTPRYPKSAERNGVDGLVVLGLNINTQGQVESVTVLSVEAERYSKSFVKSAKRAALKTRFFPQTVDGVPISVRGVIKRYRFKSL